MDELDAAAVQGKITLLPGYDAELTSVTFSIQNEDHTIGNALRYMLMKEYVQIDAAPMITPFSPDKCWGLKQIGILRF